MPELTDPKVVSAMRSAVAEVSRARAALRALGDRPDHEAVDASRVRLAEIDAELAMTLQDVALSDRAPTQTHLEELKGEAEKERDGYKAVISLDEMHDAYEKMLSEAEAKLTRIYEAAVAGRDVEEESKVVAQEEVNEEVLAILEEAFEKKMEKIDLSGRQLQFLPEAFGRLHGLVVLNLSSNQLLSIPDSIGDLESLEELHVSSNLLEILPDSIGKLLNLKILDVSRNKIVTLPDTICHCRSLVELDASFNRLTYLPTNIGYELVNLVRLSVHLNKIRSLPTSVGEMRSLRSLDLHFNELRGLPSTIGTLVNLETLNLGSNFSDLKELPNSIGNLTNLRDLDLNNNQIHSLPDTFGRLNNLEKLNLEENPLEVPPMEVVREGAKAVVAFMANRWLEILEEEERKSMLVNEEGKNGWLTRSTSWLNNVASGVSGYLGSPKSPADSYLNEQR